MRDRFGIFGTVTRFRELSLLLVMMLRIPNTQRLADRAAQTQLSEEMMKAKLFTDEKHKNIGALKSSGDALKHKISDLLAKREDLLAELKLHHH